MSDSNNNSGPAQFDEPDPHDIDPESELVALRLVAGDSHAAAGLAIGRSAKWVQRRLRDPVFRNYVTSLRSARVEQAAAGLGSLLERAVSVVGEGLESDRLCDRLAAARLVFDRSRVFRADADLAAEIDDLRVQVQELGDLAQVRAGGAS